MHRFTRTPSGDTLAFENTGALVVQNVGSRIGRGVRLAALPPLELALRPPREDEERDLVVLDDWELGDMSPAQRYEFAIELKDEDDLARLMGSDLTVSRKRGFLRDYSTTIRIGGPGLGAVSLVDRTSPAGMVSVPLRSIDATLRNIHNRMKR